jgi:hypothetical protein
MTWILPKQLHTLAYALDTEALSLDLAEQSQICAQSLFVRSKHSLPRTWFQKWKRDSWTQHLSGRILRPSLGQSFVEKWTSSLVATHANHSVPLESDSERKIQDTSGLSLQMELLQCDQVSVSLKTSKDISRWGCPTSSKTWQEWVTERRGAYSLRVKLAHLTSGSGCSSWPTMTDNEAHNTACPSQFKRNSLPLTARVMVEMFGQADQANHSTDGNHRELSWPTPEASQGGRQGSSFSQKSWKKKDGTPKQLSLAQQALIQELNQQVKAWGTPSVTVTGGPTGLGGGSGNKKKMSALGPEGKAMCTGRLNPRWAETLMGLPIGWTMPSCSSPLTIAPTNCDYLETESFLPPQNEHSELF